MTSPEGGEGGLQLQEERILELEGQLKRAAEYGKALLRQNEQLASVKTELSNQVAQLQEAHKLLSSRYEATKELTTETEQRNTDLEEMVDSLQRLSSEQQAEINKLKAGEQAHRQLRAEYEICKQKLAISEEQLRAAVADKKRAEQAATAQLSHNTHSLQKDIQERDQEIERLRAAGQQVSALEEENRKLQLANQAIPQLEADKEKLSSAVKNIVKVNRRLQLQLDEYQKLYTQAQSAITSLQEQSMASSHFPHKDLSASSSLADELESALNQSSPSLDDSSSFIHDLPDPDHDSSFSSSTSSASSSSSTTPSSSAPTTESFELSEIDPSSSSPSSSSSSSSSSSPSTSSAYDPSTELALLDLVMEWRGFLNDSTTTLTSNMMNQHLDLPDLLHVSNELLKVVQEEVKARLSLEGEKKLLGQSREIICQLLELILQNTEFRLELNRIRLRDFKAKPPQPKSTSQRPTILSFFKSWQ